MSIGGFLWNLNVCISFVRTGKMHKLYENPFQLQGGVCSADPAEDPQDHYCKSQLHTIYFIQHTLFYIIPTI